MPFYEWVFHGGTSLSLQGTVPGVWLRRLWGSIGKKSAVQSRRLISMVYPCPIPRPSSLSGSREQHKTFKFERVVIDWRFRCSGLSEPSHSRQVGFNRTDQSWVKYTYPYGWYPSAPTVNQCGGSLGEMGIVALRPSSLSGSCNQRRDLQV